MKTEIKVKYYWREISDDGRLKEDEDRARRRVFGSYGYDTEEEALEGLKIWCDDAMCRMHREYVMIKTYKVVEAEGTR